MNSKELKKYIEFLNKSHSDPLRYQAQLYYNYAFPLSSLVMVFIAIPFSFLMGNRGAAFRHRHRRGHLHAMGDAGHFQFDGGHGAAVAVVFRLRPPGPVFGRSFILFLNIKT